MTDRMLLLLAAGVLLVGGYVVYEKHFSQCPEIAVTGTLGQSQMGVGPDDRLYLTAVRDVQCVDINKIFPPEPPAVGHSKLAF